MELVRARNALCDRYQLSRAHPSHLDLPPRNMREKQALAYFEERVDPSPPPPPLDMSMFDAILVDDEALAEVQLPSPRVAVHDAVRISTSAMAGDTPPPPTGTSAGSSLAQQPRASSVLATTAAASTALVPSWLALPTEETAQRVSLVSLGVRELPSLALDGTPYDRPFHIVGLPSVATRGERRAAAKAAKAEMEGTITAEEFNKLLGTGELVLEEGEVRGVDGDARHQEQELVQGGPAVLHQQPHHRQVIRQEAAAGAEGDA